MRKTEYDYHCGELSERLRVQIHSADEVPQLEKHFYHISSDHDVRIAVRPNLMITSSNLIWNYTTKRSSGYIGHWNGQNMWMRFFFRCLNTTVQKCAVLESVWNLLHNANLTMKSLPVFNLNSYDAEISISKNENALYRNVKDGLKVIKMSVLLKDQQYFASLRSELYGTMGFIAACGGILNLFTGISLLSIINFASFCLTCYLYTNKMWPRNECEFSNMFYIVKLVFEGNVLIFPSVIRKRIYVHCTYYICFSAVYLWKSCNLFFPIGLFAILLQLMLILCVKFARHAWLRVCGKWGIQNNHVRFHFNSTNRKSDG